MAFDDASIDAVNEAIKTIITNRSARRQITLVLRDADVTLTDEERDAIRIRLQSEILAARQTIKQQASTW